MRAVVLGSLAVYGSTAALLLGAAHRWVQPLRLRIALIIAAAPLLFTGGATLRGNVYAPLEIVYLFEPLASHRGEVGVGPLKTPLLSDVVYSMIPWQKAVREAVKNGRAPLWNRFVLAGEPLLAVQQPAVLHPFTVIGFLLPLAQAWTFQMSARLLLALLAAYLLFRDMGCRDSAALLGALGWAFSDFMIFWLGYSVGNAIGPFPLLVLGVSRLAKDADRRAVALTVAALILIITAGHPESLLFAVASAGVYFLFLLAWAGPRNRARPVLLSAAAGAVALGLTAVQLAPMAEALPQTWEHGFRSSYYAHLKKSVAPGESARRALTYLLPFAHGESGRGEVRPGFGNPGGYAGAILLPLAACGLFSPDRRRWALIALGLLGIALWARLAVVTDAVAALPLFDIAVNDYLVFLAAFATCALAALGTENLLAGSGRPSFLSGAALSLAGIAILGLVLSGGMRQLMPPEYVRRRILLEVVPIALALMVVAFRRRPGARAWAAVLLALLVASRAIEAVGVYPSRPAAALAPALRILDPIPRGAPVRMVAMGEMLVPNTSALYEIEDVRGYESMTLRSFVATYPLWCKPQGAWFNRVDDLEKPFLDFLNVRYALVPTSYPPPPGWALRARDRGADLLENTRCLPRAFAPEWIRFETDESKRLELLASIADFRERGVLGSHGGTPTGAWARNGSARVTIASYRAQSMDLAVDASQDTVLGTSVPSWSGWKAKLDGRSVATLSYNNAFLGFRVPAGIHRLELRYGPDSVAIGAVISLATLAVLAVGAFLSRNASRVFVLPSPRRP